MKLKMYTIKDNIAGIFRPPFPAINMKEAIRAFDIRLKQPNELMALYPNDFSLYYVGEFDDNVGSIIQGEIQHIINANDLVKDVEDVKYNSSESSDN